MSWIFSPNENNVCQVVLPNGNIPPPPYPFFQGARELFLANMAVAIAALVEGAHFQQGRNQSTEAEG